MSIPDQINLAVAVLTLFALGVAIWEIFQASKRAKIDRANSLIDRYFDALKDLPTGQGLFYNVSRPGPPNMSVEEGDAIIREWSLNRIKLNEYLYRLSRYWFSNSIDKDTIRHHLGFELIHKFDSIRSYHLRTGEKLPIDLEEVQFMIDEIRNPKPNFDQLIKRLRG